MSRAFSAFRAKLVIFLRFKSAAAAAFPAAAGLKIRRDNIFRQRGNLASFDLPAQFGINGYDFVAAAGPDTILAAPFENGDEEKAETGIDHINFQMSVFSAASADNKLIEIQLLFSLADSHNKKHVCLPPLIVMAQIDSQVPVLSQYVSVSGGRLRSFPEAG